jgi:hypothetical protein
VSKDKNLTAVRLVWIYSGFMARNKNYTHPRDYQDELDTDPNKHDRATEEETDDLADTAGIPRGELAHELRRLKLDDVGHGDDDVREDMEDRDEDVEEGSDRPSSD